jgi:hypothetical protein
LFFLRYYFWIFCEYLLMLKQQSERQAVGETKRPNAMAFHLGHGHVLCE